MEPLEAVAQQLLTASLAKSTWVAYTRAIEGFLKFRSEWSLRDAWPIDSASVIAYISWLFMEGRAASTINLHISAISFVHKVNGWMDPTSSFLVGKLKEGCRRLKPSCDSRRPITFPVLQRLVDILPPICTSFYEATLFRAAFVLAFFGFLRVGEFTCANKKGDFSHVIQSGDVLINQDKSQMKVILRSSKTDQGGKAAEILIGKNEKGSLCPVQAVSDFMSVRPCTGGPFFVHFDNTPLTSYQIGHMVKKGVKVLGLPPQSFSSHSFRIGAATSASICGISDDNIKSMGRWRSTAFELYIRPHSLESFV